MVSDEDEILGRALGRVVDDAPSWGRRVDDFVVEAHRHRSRRRARVAAGTSVGAELAVGVLASAPAVVAALRRAPAAPATGVLVGGRPSADPPAGPSGPSASTAPPTRAANPGTTVEQRFLNAGYDYDDATLLARYWGHGLSPGEAKARAGEKIRDGFPLPIRHGQTASTVGETVALGAFFNNGYDYAEAARLAALWHRPAPGGDLAAVKALAGRRLLAGQALPRTAP